MRIRLLIIGALLSFVSCSDIIIIGPLGSEGDYKLSDSFVNWFFKFSRLDIFPESTTGSTDDYIFQVQGGFDEYFTPEHRPEGYRHYCDIFNDHGLNMYVGTNQGSVNNIESMNVYSDSDFPSHKAGELLNDIVFAKFYTAKPFIDNHYPKSMVSKDPIKVDDIWHLGPRQGYTVVEKRLSELSSDDCYLIEKFFKLRFVEKPIEQKNVTIFFEIVEEDGNTLSTATILNFYKDYHEYE